MNIVKKCRSYLQYEKKIIAANRKMLQKSNETLFTLLIGGGSIFSIIMFFITFFVKAYSSMRFSYIIIFILLSTALFIQLKRKDVDSVWIYYVFYGLFAGYAAYSSAFVTPEYIGIIILIFLFEIPVIILDYSVRIILYEVLVAAVYLAIVLPNKASYLVADEITNTLMFMCLGSATGTFFRIIRLKSMDLSLRLNKERTTDVLTGLFNRRMLFEYIGKYETKQIQEIPFAVAIIDIDNFKLFNDTYGHIEGDKCLGQLGECFKRFGNSHGTLFYRYGGEEFVAIVNQEPTCNLTMFFSELNKEIENLKIPHQSMPCGYVTVSIGVVRVGKTDTSVKFEQKIDNADKALYRAKESGKTKTVEYSEHLNIPNQC